jgi:hypothetical protein
MSMENVEKEVAGKNGRSYLEYLKAWKRLGGPKTLRWNKRTGWTTDTEGLRQQIENRRDPEKAKDRLQRTELNRRFGRLQVRD